MTDILERLREESLQLARRSFDSVDAGLSANVADAAIDEIERLRNSLKHMEGGLLLLQSAVRAGESKKDISSRIDEEVRRIKILVGGPKDG